MMSVFLHLLHELIAHNHLTLNVSSVKVLSISHLLQKQLFWCN